jgi:hypothetical protein
LSREEEAAEDDEPILELFHLPSPKESAAFLSQNSSMLLATFGFALIWFAQVAKGACPVHANGMAAATKVTVTAPPNLALATSASTLSRRLERSNSAGRFLAMGHMGLALNEDAPASRPPPSARDPMRSNSAGRFLAMGHMGLALNEDAPASRPPPASAPRQRSDAGLFLATGIFGLVFSQEPFAVLDVPNTTEALGSLSPAETSAFVMTCALVHTLIVCVGMAIGNDTLTDIHALTELLRTVAVLFLLFCGALWWSWEYKVGPVPPIAELLFASETSYVFGGAASLCAWLVASMVLPHTGPFGRLYTSSRALHQVIATIGVGLYLLDMPTFGVAACFGTFLAMMPGAKVAARSSTIAAAMTSL